MAILTRQQILDKLAPVVDDLHGLGVVSLELFGSVARNDATQNSDVDLLVTFQADMKLSLFDLARVHGFLEDLLNCEIDLVMRDNVYPQLRDRIYGEAIRVA